MRDRVMGIENELGIMLHHSERGYRAMLQGENLSLHPDDCPDSVYYAARFWIFNGGSVYKDMGHPEYTSPECRTSKDLVAYTKAGELLTRDIFNYTWSDGSKIELFKNNLGIEHEGSINASYGCHENYLLRFYSPDDEVLQRHLIPFLVSRQILGGSGWWKPGGVFSMSQRALVMGVSASAITTQSGGRRGIVYTSDESLSRIKGFHRLQLIVGDANMLEFPLYLKSGITSIVLAMLEDGIFMDIDLVSPPRTIREVALDSTGQEKLMRTLSGERLSALEVQYLYLEKARSYLARTSFTSEEKEAEYLKLLSCWEAALNAIYSQDIEWMLGRLDYVTKRWLAEKEIEKKGIEGSSSKMNVFKKYDLFYHNISKRGLMDKIEQKWSDRRIVSDDDIQKALDEPPADTRARLRGKFCRHVRRHMDNTHPDTRRRGLAVQWSSLNYQGNQFEIQDPLTARHDRLEKFLDSLSE